MYYNIYLYIYKIFFYLEFIKFCSYGFFKQYFFIKVLRFQYCFVYFIEMKVNLIGWVDIFGDINNMVNFSFFEKINFEFDFI